MDSVKIIRNYLNRNLSFSFSFCVLPMIKRKHNLLNRFHWRRRFLRCLMLRESVDLKADHRSQYKYTHNNINIYMYISSVNWKSYNKAKDVIACKIGANNNFFVFFSFRRAQSSCF